MMWNNWNGFVLVAVFFAVTVKCNPKYDVTSSFVPSSIDYLEKAGKAQDQIAISSQVDGRSANEVSTSKRGITDTSDISDRNQEPRFGFTNIGGSSTGYGVTSYAPTKIDLGGVLLGAVIGVGTILVIPKLLYVLSGTYGAYARSDEESGLAQTMTRLDDALTRHGIDTTSCMQRAVCSYSHQAAAAVRGGASENQISSFDKIIDTIATNQMFRTAMQGTAIQEAIEAGRTGQSCSHIYPQCGFSMETTLSLLTNVISSFTAANARTAASSASV